MHHTLQLRKPNGICRSYLTIQNWPLPWKGLKISFRFGAPTTILEFRSQPHNINIVKHVIFNKDLSSILQYLSY